MHVPFTTEHILFFSVDIDNTPAGRWSAGSFPEHRLVIDPILAHGLLEYRHTDDVTGSLCSLFYSTCWAVLKMFARLFQITKRRLLTNKKNGETKTKRVLDDLKIPKLVEIFTTVAIECHRYERFFKTVLKMFSQLYCFTQMKELAENFLEKLYTSKMKKEEEETKSNFWDLKNALTSTNPRTVEWYQASRFFFLLYSLYKTNRFDVA